VPSVRSLGLGVSEFAITSATDYGTVMLVVLILGMKSISFAVFFYPMMLIV
jgi:hypothetical protein